MANIRKVHGNTVAPAEQIGRDVQWIGVVCGDAVLNEVVPVLVDGVVESSEGAQTYLDKVRQIVDNAASVTLTGGNTTTEVMFMTEGFGITRDADGNEPTQTQQAAELRRQLLLVAGEGEAAHLGTIEVTLEDVTGVDFVASVTVNS